MKTPSKEKSILKGLEWMIAFPVLLTIFSSGLYQLYGKDVVADTAREVAEQVVDSVMVEQSVHIKAQSKQIKILHNYMMLQNKDLYEQAKELEEN